MLEQDPDARVACEVACAFDAVNIFGEVTTTATINYDAVARSVIREIGYTAPKNGFDAENCIIHTVLHEQSPDIARGIDRRTEQEWLNSGAGDQGIMIGYACRETSSLMSQPIELAHSLAKRLEQVRRMNELKYLLPDGKTQVSVEYDEHQRPVRIAAVIVSAQHREMVETSDLRKDILNHVILPTLPKKLLDRDTQFFVNPTGRFVWGGPGADSGLTGRKLMADTYDGCARHGAVRFLARMPLRWIAAVRIWPGIWRRILWRPGWQNRCRLDWTPLVPNMSRKKRSVLLCCRQWIFGRGPSFRNLA